jgi:hypothetical protein
MNKTFFSPSGNFAKPFTAKPFQRQLLELQNMNTLLAEKRILFAETLTS